MSEVVEKYFLTGRTEMMAELLNSRHSNKIVGIWAKSISKSMMLCSVKEVSQDADEGDVLIVFEEIDTSLDRPTAHVVYLNEIDRMYNFQARPNPSLKVHR